MMEYKNANNEYARNHRLWARGGKPMHAETKEEIAMRQEEICKNCQYYKRVDGDMMCTATDEQWRTDDSIPCREEKNNEL